MTFREAFLYACDRNPKACRGKAKLIRQAQQADFRNKRVAKRWERMEERMVGQYKDDTGRDVKEFGDGKFLDWLIENLPKLIQILMTILALFGV